MSTAQFVSGNDSISVSEQGFRFQNSKGVQQGGWHRATGIMTMSTGLEVAGSRVAAWQHFTLTLDGGQSFSLRSQAPEAFEVARLAVQYAAAPINDQVNAALDAGEEVSFGKVRLSREHISVGRKSWPIEQLGGHRTAHGMWMLDILEGGQPRMVASMTLMHVTNHFALCNALDQLKPGCEYEENGPDLGTMFRPSASSHDPRGVSGRTRLLMLAIPVLLGVAGWFGYLGWVKYAREQEAQRIATALASRLGEVERLAAVARAAPAPSAAWECANGPKTASEVAVVVEASGGVAHPARGEPFSIRDGWRVEPIAPFATLRWLLFARVTRFDVTKADGSVEAELESSVSLVDTAGKVVCSGVFNRRSRSPVESSLMSQALLSSLCGELDDCAKVSGVEPLVAPPPVPKEEVKAVAQVETPVQPPPAAPTYKKGTKVTAQNKKGKWLPAVVLAVSKKGVKVHYDKTAKKFDEVVPLTRLKLR